MQMEDGETEIIYWYYFYTLCVYLRGSLSYFRNKHCCYPLSVSVYKVLFHCSLTSSVAFPNDLSESIQGLSHYTSTTPASSEGTQTYTCSLSCLSLPPFHPSPFSLSLRFFLSLPPSLSHSPSLSLSPAPALCHRG